MGRLLALYHRLQHLLLILLCLGLLLGSGKVMLLRGIPSSAGFWDYSHLGLGVLCTLVVLTFLWHVCAGGGWRQYFALFTGNWQPVWQDLCGLSRGKIPAAGGAGLFSLIEGLTLLALLAVGLSGCLWLIQQGTAAALMWRGWHITLVYVFLSCLIVHMLCALSHLLDLLRD